jgi:hypothetical protein
MTRILALLGVCAVLAAGCGSSDAGTPAAPATAVGSGSPGRPMPDGSTTDTPTPTAAPARLTLMVCAGDVPADVAAIFDRPTVPVTSRTWVDNLYTCTFQLPVGPLVLSVQESADPAAARAHYAAGRKRFPAATDLPGLGEIAYLTPGGTVGLVKDNVTLTVDATALPATFGADRQKRTDFAYEVATVVLGCWTGHG